ncbi:hypothetical protein ABBQ32_006674 [Trebouxia sp. C0010 RCD-2024]
MAAKDASRFWRLFKTPHSNACPVELSAQFAAFRALMGAEPLPAPTRHAASVVERVESYKYLGFVLHATSNDIWDDLSGGSCQEGDVCHAEAVCTSGHQGPCYAVQAI